MRMLGRGAAWGYCYCFDCITPTKNWRKSSKRRVKRREVRSWRRETEQER